MLINNGGEGVLTTYLEFGLNIIKVSNPNNIFDTSQRSIELNSGLILAHDQLELNRV